MSISGFSFVHNGLEGGYPIVEAIRAVQPFVEEVVVVDMDSDDGTRELLERMPVRVLESPWCSEDLGWRGDQVLVEAYHLHMQCQGDAIIMFEADEVYDWHLLQEVVRRIHDGRPDQAVYRLQLEQNFQRCRWYPVPVHRVFPRGGGSYPQNPVVCPDWVERVDPAHGFLWDVAGCFRDNWRDRRANQKDLWEHQRALAVAEHFAQPNEYMDEPAFLAGEHWTWKRSPFAIPAVLERLVGMTRYEPGV